MSDGRVIPREPDVSVPQRPAERFGGSGRTGKTSAFVRDASVLAGIPNAVRRDHRLLQQTLQGAALSDTELPDWMAYAQHDRGVEDGTIVFPAARAPEPGLDYLGRPTGRRHSDLR